MNEPWWYKVSMSIVAVMLAYLLIIYFMMGGGMIP